MRDLRILLTALLVPVLVAVLAMWSFQGSGPRGETAHATAAIVNLDEGATFTLPDGTDQFVPLGRQLAAELIGQELSTPLVTWEIMRESTALSRLAEGSVAAVVTIPSGFSADLATLGTEDATPAIISLATADSNAPTTDEIAELVTRAAGTTLGRSLTTQMLDGVYLGFDTMSDQLGAAADGADRIATGVGELGDGLGDLADGAGQAATGAGLLSDGAGRLADGTGQARSGAGELASGLDTLGAGAGTLASGLDALRAGVTGGGDSPGLVGGVDQLADGVLGTPTAPGLADGTRDLAAGAAQLSDGIGRLEAGVAPLRELLPTPEEVENLPKIDVDLAEALAASREVALAARSLLDSLSPTLEDPETIAALTDALDTLVDECPREAAADHCALLEGTVTTLRPWVEALPTLSALSTDSLDRFLALTADEELPDRLRELQASIDEAGGLVASLNGEGGLLDGISQLATGAEQLAEGARALDEGVNGSAAAPGLVDGVRELRAGAHALAAGLDGTGTSPGLVDGGHSLAAGAHDAAAGAHTLASGIGEIDDGARAFATGASDLGAGLRDLADGARTAHAGTGALADGADTLASGLADAVDAIPSMDALTRTRVVAMAVDPVRTLTDEAATSTTDFAYPFVVPLLTWMLAFGAFLVMPGLRRRVVERPIGAARAVLESLRMPATVSATSILGAALVALIFEVRPVDPWVTGLLVVTGAVVSVLTHQALLAVCGMRLGRVAALVFLMVQTVALVGLLPYQESAATIRAVNAFLPIGEVATALRVSVHGVGDSWVPSFLALAAWGGVGFVASVVAVAQHRAVSASRLDRQLDVPRQ